MKRRWAVCPSLGRSDSWRTIWRIPSAADDIYVVRGQDQRGCEDPLDPAEAYRVIDRWAADRDAHAQLLKLYDVLRAPPLGPGLPDVVMARTVKPRLHEAFKRGELLLIRIPPRGIGAGAADALLAPAPGKLPPEKQKKEQVEHLLLQILRVDDHFVPKTEKLDIVYELEGFSGKSVHLDIESKHLGLVFSKDLEAPERTDGSHTFYWDGKCTSPADRYAHPLLSPFRVHLYHNATWTDERNFKILYHSIVLKNGPWTPDEKEPAESDEKPWAAYRLNQLGYYGGPVGTDLDDYLKKAIIRYKANHKKLRGQYYPDYDDTISPALKAALKAKENDRKFPVPAATEDPGAKSVLNVEALTYERTGPGADEFGDKRSTHEQDRLNRPLVPVEVEIWLKKKDNSKVFQPEAVGPCRIAWRFADPDEDLSPQYAKTASEPSTTKTFIEKSLKLKSGRTGTNGDNCPKDFAGIREDPATNWRTPFETGDSYVPYSVQEDGGNKVAFTIACEDKAKYPRRQGKAGVFFRPSYIAADDCKLSAEIDFTGQPNKEELEKLHGITSPGKKIKAETGTYTVRRFNKVAMSIDWPARKNSYEWDKIATEFGKAFNDVDTKGIVTKKIGQVLTEKQYKDIVTANTAHTDPSKIGYYADYLVGLKLPQQGNLDADDYKTALKTFCHDDYNDKIQTPLGAQISENVRKEHPSGFIIVSFLLHRPVNIKNDPANGDNKVSKANQGFVTWGGSIGLADSVILADQKDPDKVYYVVSHEMGHNFYLLHWENTGENNLSDHDQDDHNCTMSYSDFDYADPGHYAFQEPGKYTPHFCGKCNLALRGWDIVAGGMAAKATKLWDPKPKIAINKDDTYVLAAASNPNPPRSPVELSVTKTYSGNGTFTWAPADRLRFFKEDGVTEVLQDGASNVFSGANLKSKIKLYAQGVKGSDLQGVKLKLALANGQANTSKVTCVVPKLEIYKLDGTAIADDKKRTDGRAVHEQSGGKHKRAKIKVTLQPAKAKGTLTLEPIATGAGKVKLFAGEKGGTAVAFNQKQMKNGEQTLWVEGATVSGANNDTGLVLKWNGAEADRAAMTVVKVQLDICKPKESAAKPAPVAADAKADPGVVLYTNLRSMLVVQQAKPKAFAGNLVLVPKNDKVKAHKHEKNEDAVPNPHKVANSTIPDAGLELWAEGVALSTDKGTGFKLGLEDVEEECDAVTVTVKEIKITPKKAAYTVVLDKTGNVTGTFPLLTVDLEGPPNWYYDVQLMRTDATFSGGPGLSGAWDSTATRAVRLAKKPFSSWSNNQKTLKLGGDGKAQYEVPLEWWRDQARRKRSDFDTADISYRVLAFPDAAASSIGYSKKDSETPPKLTIKNNLDSFTLVDGGYINGGVNKHVDFKIKVREPDTQEMYTMVQWKKGDNKTWNATKVQSYGIVQDYGIDHRWNDANWIIDRLETNPRYHNGVYEHPDNKTAKTDDEPGGAMAGSDWWDWLNVDFDARVHLDFDVPATVQHSETGSAPVYDTAKGWLADPQPETLASVAWNARILQVRTVAGVTVTQPNTFAGP